MMSFPEMLLGKARFQTGRVKARTGSRRRRLTSRLEVLEERTLLSFTPIAQPTTAYTTVTNLIPINTPGGDGTQFNFITDHTLTANLSTTMYSFQIPTPQAPSPSEWNVPPAVENATPNTLEEPGSLGNSVTLTLSQPVVTFGLEMQFYPLPQTIDPTITMTATFMDGSNVVGTITQPITQTAPAAEGGQSTGGALLFAASTTQQFTSVVLSNPSATTDPYPGIQIAQVRYQLPTTPLTGSSGNEITGVEGSSTGTVLLGTFVDTNQAATPADYTTGLGSVVVNWGDGSAPQTLAAGNLTPIGTPDGVTWTINAAHTYTEEGTYAYTVTVTDSGGAATIVAGSAIVADAALTAGAPTLLTANTGVALPCSHGRRHLHRRQHVRHDRRLHGQHRLGRRLAGEHRRRRRHRDPRRVQRRGRPHLRQAGRLHDPSMTVHDDGGSQVVDGRHGHRHRSGRSPALPRTSPRSRARTPARSCWRRLKTPTRWQPSPSVNATLAVGGWGDGTPAPRASQLTVQQIGVDPATGEPIFAVLGSHTYAEETAAGTPNTFSVIITTAGGATTTLDQPSRWRGHRPRRPAHQFQRRRDHGRRGEHDRPRSCSGRSPTPTRAQPSPITRPAAAPSLSTGATARRRRPWPRRTSLLIGSPNGVIFDRQRRAYLRRGGNLRLHGHGDR